MRLSGFFVFAVSIAVVSAAAWASPFISQSAVMTAVWAGTLLPYVIALTRWDSSSAAAIPGLIVMVLSRFDPRFIFYYIAVGVAALEVKKPLGLVAYLLALFSLQNVMYDWLFNPVAAVAAVALASYASVFNTRLDRGAAMVLPIIAAETIHLTGLYALTYIYAALGASFFMAARRWFAKAAALALIVLGVVAPWFYVDVFILASLPGHWKISSTLPPVLAYLIKAAAALALMLDADGDRRRLAAAVLASVGLFFVPTPAGYFGYSERPGLEYLWFAAAAAAYCHGGRKAF
ncbi:MAG: hypothetical protein QXP31_01875 [Pyrobaculum sp.]